MQPNAKTFSCRLRVSAAKKLVATQGAMMDGEEGTTKYAKGAQGEAKLLFAVRSLISFAYFAHFVVKSYFR
jgi:hypothetical protein